MNIDLEGMSVSELKQLRRKLDQTISSFQERAREKARAAAEEAAREHGFSLNELVGGGRGRRPQQVAASDAGPTPKFRHPENDQLTWSGRGRRPGWFNDALENGHSEDDLHVA